MCPAGPPVLTVVATGVPTLPVVVLAVGAVCAAVPVVLFEVEVLVAEVPVPAGAAFALAASTVLCCLFGFISGVFPTANR